MGLAEPPLPYTSGRNDHNFEHDADHRQPDSHGHGHDHHSTYDDDHSNTDGYDDHHDSKNHCHDHDGIDSSSHDRIFDDHARVEYIDYPRGHHD